MKTEHTPKRWQLVEVFVNNAPNRLVIKEARWGGRIIADLGLASDPVVKANGKLLFASRDLLEACKALLPHAVELLEASEAIDGLTVSKVNLEWDIEHAQEAISKAEGKE